MDRPKRPTLRLLPKLIVVCEGKLTEPDYIRGLRRERRIPEARVVIHKAAGDPKRVVDEAVRLKAENDSANRDLGVDVQDVVWAVFDRDDHRQIPDAKQLAKVKGISVAFSNPCFELFLLFHYVDLQRSEHRSVVARLLREHIHDFRKAVDYSGLDLHRKYALAKKRCLAVNRRSSVTKGINSAPYCDAYRLMDSLRDMKL